MRGADFKEDKISISKAAGLFTIAFAGFVVCSGVLYHQAVVNKTANLFVAVGAILCLAAMALVIDAKISPPERVKDLPID